MDESTDVTLVALKADMLAVKKELLKVLLMVAMWGRKKVEMKDITKAVS
jgi:hypothetical protein